MKKLVVIKESKVPIDRRVVLTPEFVNFIKKEYKGVLEVKVERSDIRCYSDSQYAENDLVDENYEEADYFIGVKEVNADKLINNKTYFFFSHTIKGQPYNMSLLQTCLEKKITLIDYEAIRNEFGKRIIGFGDIAGVIGTYNTLKWYGSHYLNQNLPPAHQLNSIKELKDAILTLHLSNENLLLTGKGAVGRGAKEFLLSIGFKEVSLDNYMNNYINKELVFCNIDYNDYYINSQSCLNKYLHQTDIFIAGHYYKKGSPIILSKESISQLNKLKIVGDISCDIDGPIGCTIRSTSIDNPIFYYDKIEKKETEKLDKKSIVVMAVDNLPCELPIVSSQVFGKKFLRFVLPELLKKDSVLLNNATICSGGLLMPKYRYLEDFL